MFLGVPCLRILEHVLAKAEKPPEQLRKKKVFTLCRHRSMYLTFSSVLKGASRSASV